MVRAKTLAVVVGFAACTITLAVAGADRFIHHTSVVMGFDDSPPTATAQELLRKGIDDYRWGRYDDANRAFEQASKLPGLSEREQEILAQYRALMVRVNKSRQEATDLLAAAHKAYEQGDLKHAESLATTVAANGYASSELRDDAKEILAQVQSSNGTPPGGKPTSDVATHREAQQLIAKARQQLRQGNHEEAESLARKAESLKVSYSRFEDTPAKILKDLAAARGTKSNPSPNQAVAGNSKAQAKTLVAEAQAHLKKNELDRAELLARQAKELTANFYLFETSPDDVLNEVMRTRRQQSTVAAKDKTALPATDQAKQLIPAEAPSEGVKMASHEPPITIEPSTESSSRVLVASPESSAGSDVVNLRPVESAADTSTESSAHPAETGQAIQEPVLEATTITPFKLEETMPQDIPTETDARTKAEVRQLLAQARKLIDNGRLDDAEQIVAQAESRNVQWGPFDNPVQKTRRDLAVASNQAMAAEHAATAETLGSNNPPAGDARTAALEQLRQGRAHLRAGNVDKAEELAHRAEQKGAKYRLLDDTPKQLLAECSQARTRTNSASIAVSQTVSDEPVDPEVAEIPTTRPVGSDKEVAKQAQAHLKKAREHLNRGDYASAIGIARRISEWHLDYGFWDDTPAKVENLAKTMKNRAVARSSRNQGQKDRSVADSLVADARRDLARGDLDAAEAKARQAQQIKASFGAFSDRPESVLADISRERRSSGNVEKITPQSVEPTPPSIEIAQAEHAMPTQSSSPHITTTPSEPPAEAVEWLAGAKTSSLSTPRRRPSSQGQGVVQQDAGTIIQTGGESGDDSGVKLADGSDIANPQAPVQGDQQKLVMARKLFEQGNYPRAREHAADVYSSNSALRPQADDLIARISVAEQAMAIQLFDAGVAALKKKEYSRALSFFRQVSASGAQLDPGTEQQLRSYLRDLPARAGVPAASNTGVAVVSDGTVQPATQDDASQVPTNDLSQRERAKFQQLVTETNQKVQSAKLLLQTNPSQAIKDLELAQENVRASGLDEGLTGMLVRRLDGAIRAASQEKQRLDFDNVRKAASDATKSRRERELAVEQHKQQELFQLIERGNAHLKEGRYRDAEEDGRRANELAPDNQAAIALLHKAKVETQLENQRELRELKDSRLLETLHAVDGSAVSFGNDNEISMRYPDATRWEHLTSDRKRRLEQIENRSRSPRELEIERKLSDPITIEFTEAPLDDVVAFLHDATGVNVFLDKHALAVDGISSDKPITIKLENIPLKSALKILLDQMDLEYTIENDVLLITTPIKRQGKMYSKTYSVADLVVPISPSQNMGGAGPYNNGGSIGIGSGVPGMSPTGMPMHNAGLAQIGTGLGGSPPLTGVNNSPGMGGAAPNGTGSGQVVDFDALIQLIESTISPNSWTTVGGAGTIEEFAPNLSLVVNNTQAVHDQIADLLTQLRRLQDLQVTIEVKFITLTEDFFERIGIDFDIDVQSDAQKPLRSFGQVLIPGGAGAGGGGGGAQQQTPNVLNLIYNDHDDDVTVGVNSSRGANGLGVGGTPVFSPDLKIPFRTGGFGNGRPTGFVPGDGLSFGIAFLSDIEVFLFLEAAQQNNRGNVLTAPKVTLFNGSTAFVFSGSVEPFVTALNPVIAAGAVAFDPQIQQFFNGAFLSVTAVISADRRYVRVTLFPSFNNISGEKRFTVTGAAAGGGGFGGGGGGGGAANAQAEIVVPIISINTVVTTVSVPDGGTILLGGLKTKSEIRSEFGTPILNKIPYINRLYMNTGVSSISRSLLLMVTPRIIIQEEEEELLGKTIAF